MWWKGGGSLVALWSDDATFYEPFTRLMQIYIRYAKRAAIGVWYAVLSSVLDWQPLSLSYSFSKKCIPIHKQNNNEEGETLGALETLGFHSSIP